MAPMMPIKKRTLIVTIRMVIWRPCRHIEFDFGLTFARPNPFTTVKCVDEAIETWSKSLAFCFWSIAPFSLMSSTEWFWDCWAVTALVSGLLIRSCLKFCDWSLVKFSRLVTLSSKDDALCVEAKIMRIKVKWRTYRNLHANCKCRPMTSLVMTSIHDGVFLNSSIAFLGQICVALLRFWWMKQMMKSKMEVSLDLHYDICDDF